MGETALFPVAAVLSLSQLHALDVSQRAVEVVATNGAPEDKLRRTSGGWAFGQSQGCSPNSDRERPSWPLAFGEASSSCKRPITARIFSTRCVGTSERLACPREEGEGTHGTPKCPRGGARCAEVQRLGGREDAAEDPATVEDAAEDPARGLGATKGVW